MDRGAWRATVPKLTRSQTRTEQLSPHTQPLKRKLIISEVTPGFPTSGLCSEWLMDFRQRVSEPVGGREASSRLSPAPLFLLFPPFSFFFIPFIKIYSILGIGLNT